MSMPFREQLPRRVFKAGDFAKSSTIDKIRISYIDGNFELSPRLQAYAERLHEVFIILCSHTRQVVAAREIRKKYPECSGRIINKMISHVQYLYANITERNELWEVMNHKERLLRHIERCEGEDDMENVARFEKLIVELDKRLERLTPRLEKSGIEMPKIMLSADPSLLAAQNMRHGEEEE